MADIVQGLFGLTPDEVRQQQYQTADTGAMEFARLDPYQKAAYMGGKAGAGLVQAIAPMMGGVNIEQQRAQNLQGAASGANLSTAQGLRELAAKMSQIGEPQRALMLATKAAEMDKAEAAALAASKKTELDERKQIFKETEEMDLKKLTAGNNYKSAIEKLRILENHYNSTAVTNQQKADAAAAMVDVRRELGEAANELKRYGIDVAAAAKAQAAAAKAQTDAITNAPKIEKANAQREAKMSSINTAVTHLDAIERNINKLVDDKGVMRRNASDLFGKIDQYRPGLLQTQGTTDANDALLALKEQMSMLNLAEAKKIVGQSFGSMQKGEWDRFVNLVGSLGRKQSPESAAGNIVEIRKLLVKNKESFAKALAAMGTPTAPEANAPQSRDVGATPLPGATATPRAAIPPPTRPGAVPVKTMSWGDMPK